MLKLDKQYHILPQGKFWGKKAVVIILFIVIVSSHLYAGILNEEGFWGTYWYLFLFVSYIIYQVWIDEEIDKKIKGNLK